MSAPISPTADAREQMHQRQLMIHWLMGMDGGYARDTVAHILSESHYDGATALQMLRSQETEQQRRHQGGSGVPLPWKKLAELVIRVVGSSASLAAIRRLLRYQSVTSGPQDMSVIATLEGSEFGGRTTGMLDGVMRLLKDTVLLYPAIASKVRNYLP